MPVKNSKFTISLPISPTGHWGFHGLSPGGMGGGTLYTGHTRGVPLGRVGLRGFFPSQAPALSKISLAKPPVFNNISPAKVEFFVINSLLAFLF